jgi:hypothetical protein
MTNEQIGAAARVYLTEEPHFTRSHRSRISVSAFTDSKWALDKFHRRGASA